MNSGLKSAWPTHLASDNAQQAKQDDSPIVHRATEFTRIVRGIERVDIILAPLHGLA